MLRALLAQEKGLVYLDIDLIPVASNDRFHCDRKLSRSADPAATQIHTENLQYLIHNSNVYYTPQKKEHVYSYKYRNSYVWKKVM